MATEAAPWGAAGGLPAIFGPGFAAARKGAAATGLTAFASAAGAVSALGAGRFGPVPAADPACAGFAAATFGAGAAREGLPEPAGAGFTPVCLDAGSSAAARTATVCFAGALLHPLAGTVAFTCFVMPTERKVLPASDDLPPARAFDRLWAPEIGVTALRSLVADAFMGEPRGSR